jgi:hypothetical protein
VINELNNCKICGEKVLALNHFYRSHGIKLEDYTIKFFPRIDILDKTPILFKTPEQYFSADFNNRNNLKKYLKGISKDLAIEYCKSLIIKRIQEKNLQYIPLQIELASLPCFPPVHFLLSLFDYYDFCRSLGLKDRIDNNFKSLNMSELSDNDFIIVDSRENSVLKFEVPYKVEKLNAGDYAFNRNPNIVFERKSLPDFCSTLSGGLERFTRELERAQESGIYVVMIIENKLQDAMCFNHLPWMKRVKTKATPEFIFHNLRSLIQTFPRFQPLFVDGRKQAMEYIMKGFLSGDTFTKIDLQLMYYLDKI